MYAIQASLQSFALVGVAPVIQVPVPSSHTTLPVVCVEVLALAPVHYPFAVESLNNAAQSSAIFDAPKAAYHQR